MFKSYTLAQDIHDVLDNPSSSLDDLTNFYDTYFDKILHMYVNDFHTPDTIELFTKFVSHPNVSGELINFVMFSIPVLDELEERDTTPNFEELVNAVLANPITNNSSLTTIARNASKPEYIRRSLEHSNCSKELFEYCLKTSYPPVRMVAEQLLIERDGLQDWPTDWLENHYGRKFFKTEETHV